MNTNCKICGAEDLYSFATGEGVCSVCTMKFFGGGSARQEQIVNVRQRLGLQAGEFFKQDNATEAKKILGR